MLPTALAATGLAALTVRWVWTRPPFLGDE
jgi:hypothetical protein